MQIAGVAGQVSLEITPDGDDLHYLFHEKGEAQAVKIVLEEASNIEGHKYAIAYEAAYEDLTGAQRSGQGDKLLSADGDPENTFITVWSRSTLSMPVKSLVIAEALLEYPLTGSLTIPSNPSQGLVSEARIRVTHSPGVEAMVLQWATQYCNNQGQNLDTRTVQESDPNRGRDYQLDFECGS